MQLAITLNMDMDKLLSKPVSDFMDIIKEVSEVVSDRKRAQAGDQNRRNHR